MNDMPVETKAKLLELAKRLPDHARSPFVKNSASRLQALAIQYPNTLVYTAVGFVAGEVLDNLLTVNLPLTEIGGCLIGDYGSHLGAVLGTVLGFQKDLERDDMNKRVSAILGEELRSAMGAA